MLLGYMLWVIGLDYMLWALHDGPRCPPEEGRLYVMGDRVRVYVGVIGLGYMVQEYTLDQVDTQTYTHAHPQTYTYPTQKHTHKHTHKHAHTLASKSSSLYCFMAF